jgi:hypothetical protein
VDRNGKFGRSFEINSNTKERSMKNKIGLNMGWAILAFPLGLALVQEFNFETFAFKKTVLGILYLVTFCVCVVLMLKKGKTESKE